MRERANTHLSLQSTAKRFASVIEKTSKWSNFTKEETSTLATVLMESVESTMLAAFLKPSANVSQTIQTKHLGRIYLSRSLLGADLGGWLWHCDSPCLSHIPHPTCVSCIGRWILYHWTTWEAPIYKIKFNNWVGWKVRLDFSVR